MDDKLHLFIRTEFQFHQAQGFTLKQKLKNILNKIKLKIFLFFFKKCPANR